MVGGRPLPLGCGGPRAQRAVSSSFVKFRQIDGIDETARWVPHHPRPRAGPSVPAPTGYHAHGPVYGAYVMVCMSCYARFAYAKQRCGGGRGEQRERGEQEWMSCLSKANLPSEVKVLMVPKRGEHCGFHSVETHCGFRSPSAVRQTSGQT